MRKSGRIVAELETVRAFCVAGSSLADRGVPIPLWWRLSAGDAVSWGSIPGQALRAAAASGRSLGLCFQAVCDEQGEPGAWGRVAAVLLLCEHVGASSAAGLRAVSAWAARGLRRERQQAAAVTIPVVTSRLLAALPVVSIASTLLMGTESIRILCTTPVGWGLLSTSLILSWLGVRWRSRILSRIRIPEEEGIWMLPVALQTGMDVGHARERANAVLLQCGIRPVGEERLGHIEELCRQTGIPAAVLVAEEVRRQDRLTDATFERAVARAEAAVLIPLAVCHLPAFVMVGVVPLVLGLLSTLQW